MANHTSQPILGTAANLLGFCLFVITSFHVANKSESSIIDEITALIALLLAFSCTFSFLSIRTEKPELERRLENIGNYLFLSSLVGICIVIVLLVFNFVK